MQTEKKKPASMRALFILFGSPVRIRIREEWMTASGRELTNATGSRQPQAAPEFGVTPPVRY